MNAQPTWYDPNLLAHEAVALLDSKAAETSPAETSAEEAIRSAHALVSPDLYVIDRLRESGITPDYQALFGARFDEKVAALILLTKHKLIDIEHSSMESRDIADARRDLSNYVETLFRLKAVEALGIFYEFASSQRNSRVPQLWKNVCTRCLHLMALLSESREAVLSFLHENPSARERFQELAVTTKPEIAGAFQSVMTDYSGKQPSDWPQATAIPTPKYVALFQNTDRKISDLGAVGMTSLLTAEDRIQQAINTGDTPSIVRWIAEGSPAAMRKTFQTASSILPPEQYIDLLEHTIDHPGLDMVRLAAALIELGNLNRNSGKRGGLQRITRSLRKIALTEDEQQIGAAKIAVNELGMVNAFTEILDIIEKAPLLQVAEHAVTVFKNSRNLPPAEAILQRRPELRAIYQQARQEINELQSLVESVCSCPSEELAEIYLERLKNLKAIPELKQISMRESKVGEQASAILDELTSKSRLSPYL